jgi:hypothetical protein
MILLFFILFFVLLLISAIILDKVGNNDYGEAINGWIFASIVSLVICIIANGITYTRVISISEEMKANEAKILIQIDMRNQLQTKFESLLDTNYANYEFAVFDKIANKNNNNQVSVNLYPELKYANVLVELTTQISNLNTQIFDYRKDIEDQKARLAKIHRSPWIFHWILPKN